MQREDPGPRIGYMPMLGLAFDIFFWIVFFAVMLLIVPRQREVVADFGVDLSGFSVAVFELSDWLRGAGRSVPGVLFAAPVVILALVGIPMLFKSRMLRPLGWVLLIVWFLVPLLAIAAVIIATFVPIIQLIESLQTQKP